MSRINLHNAWYNDLIGRYEYDSDESLDDFGPDPLPPPPPLPPPVVLVEVEPDAVVKECTKPSLLPVFAGASAYSRSWHENVAGEDTYYFVIPEYTEGYALFLIPFMVNAYSRSHNTTITITLRCNHSFQPKRFAGHRRSATFGQGYLDDLTGNPMTEPLTFFDADTDHDFDLVITPTFLTQYWAPGVRLLSLVYSQKQAVTLQSSLYAITNVRSYLPYGFKVRHEDFFTHIRESPQAWMDGTAMSVFDLPPSPVATVYRFSRPSPQRWIIEGAPLKMVGRPVFGTYSNEVDGTPTKLAVMLQDGNQSTKFVSIWPRPLENDWTAIHMFFGQERDGVVLMSDVTYGCKVYGCYIMQYTEKYEGVGYLPP